jgi:hypothetical protein
VRRFTKCNCGQCRCSSLPNRSQPAA